MKFTLFTFFLCYSKSIFIDIDFTSLCFVDYLALRDYSLIYQDGLTETSSIYHSAIVFDNVNYAMISYARAIYSLALTRVIRDMIFSSRENCHRRVYEQVPNFDIIKTHYLYNNTMDVACALNSEHLNYGNYQSFMTKKIKKIKKFKNRSFFLHDKHVFIEKEKFKTIYPDAEYIDGKWFNEKVHALKCQKISCEYRDAFVDVFIKALYEKYEFEEVVVLDCESLSSACLSFFENSIEFRFLVLNNIYKEKNLICIEKYEHIVNQLVIILKQVIPSEPDTEDHVVVIEH